MRYRACESPERLAMGGSDNLLTISFLAEPRIHPSGHKLSNLQDAKR